MDEIGSLFYIPSRRTAGEIRSSHGLFPAPVRRPRVRARNVEPWASLVSSPTTAGHVGNPTAGAALLRRHSGAGQRPCPATLDRPTAEPMPGKRVTFDEETWS